MDYKEALTGAMRGYRENMTKEGGRIQTWLIQLTYDTHHATLWEFGGTRRHEALLTTTAEIWPRQMVTQ
jgi:hypothetical protein